MSDNILRWWPKSGCTKSIASMDEDYASLRRELAEARGLLREAFIALRHPDTVGLESRIHAALHADQPDAVDYKALYYELLYAVASKYPGESRHDTALRYIRERETLPLGESCASDKSSPG